MIPFILGLCCVLLIPAMMILHGNKRHRKRRELEEYLKKKPWNN